jgi:hypothetical protein
MLQDYFRTPAKDDLQRSINSVFPDAFEEAVQAFDKWWFDTRFGTFIASLSEHDAKEDHNGRLSMWRAFGTGTSGPKVAIVLRPPAFSNGLNALHPWFSPVSYVSSGTAAEILSEVRDNVVDQVEYLRDRGRQAVVDQVFSMLLGAVTCVKHDGFEEEREWRAVYAPQRNASPLMERQLATVAGVPQVIWQLPLDGSVSPDLADIDLATIFDRLILGPSQFPAALTEAFRIRLEEAGVADASLRIFASLIPIRS